MIAFFYYTLTSTSAHKSPTWAETLQRQSWHRIRGKCIPLLGLRSRCRCAAGLQGRCSEPHAFPLSQQQALHQKGSSPRGGSGLDRHLSLWKLSSHNECLWLWREPWFRGACPVAEAREADLPTPSLPQLLLHWAVEVLHEDRLSTGPTLSPSQALAALLHQAKHRMPGLVLVKGI